MKKMLSLVIISLLVLTLCGCTLLDSFPFSRRDKNKEEPIKYKVEKIALSKGFQSAEANVEIVKRDNTKMLLASLGLMESSGVEVDKVTKSGKNINIYINNLLDTKEVRLAIPQVLLEINDSDIEKLSEMDFNIINQNYEPISLKISQSQVLKTLYSQFKIKANTIPAVDLTKLGDNIFWDISFQNIFDQENSKPSLINFNVRVDALSGEILDSHKDNISTYIDDGTLLDYIPNTHLLYKKESFKDDNKYESLWIYNIETKKRENLYTSKSKINSAIFSPDKENISLIELDDNKSDIYIISRSDKIPYKITPVDHLHPRLMKWKDNETLNFIDLSEKSSVLLAYNITENKSKVEFSSKKNICSFDVIGNKYLFLERKEDTINKTIYITEEGFQFKEIGEGFQARFFDEDTILYLSNIEKENKNILHTYDIKNEYKFKDPKFNIANYFKIDEDNVMLIVKNTYNSNYTLKKYNIEEKNIEAIASITNEKLYYDSENNIGYLDLISPDDEKEQNMIYSIDIDKLDVIENQ